MSFNVMSMVIGGGALVRVAPATRTPMPAVGGSLWARIPDGVTAEQAAALPMAAETAWRALDGLGVQPGELLLVHGAGTTVGEAAVRFALHRVFG